MATSPVKRLIIFLGFPVVTTIKSDMIAANDITQAQAGFTVDTNKVLLFFANGSMESLPLMDKHDVADKIIQHVITWLTGGTE